MAEPRVRKILAIDGGGIKGILPASYLAEVDSAVEGNVADYFDLIVGTSTGGIIALGLGLGKSPAELVELYQGLGTKVFTKRWFSSLRHLFSSKYSSDPLEDALKHAFGNRLLGHSRQRLVIPSLNFDTGGVHIYKTAHHQRFMSDYKELATTVALATSAAPTYFPSHRNSSGIPLVDGGMWANNPAGLAVVEAAGVLEWPRESIKVLSLGCSTPAFDPRLLGLALFPAGRLSWALKAVELMMSAQSSASLGTAKLLVGANNIVRISPLAPGGRFSLDGTTEIHSLQGLGVEAFRATFPAVQEIFFSELAEPFKPHYDVEQQR